MQDAARQMKAQILRIVDGSKQKICQRILAANLIRRDPFLIPILLILFLPSTQYWGFAQAHIPILRAESRNFPYMHFV